MIYTITFNPSLDYVMFVPHLHVGGVSRAQRECIFPGGKGINVAVVLERLGLPCSALGFCAGYTGKAMLGMLKGEISHLDFISLFEGQSRINVKIKSEQESDINGRGPAVSSAQFSELLNKLSVLGKDDVLVLAGAVCTGLTEEAYATILDVLKDRGVLCVVDAAGDLLKKSLSRRPFLIKPNTAELADLFGTDIQTEEDLEKYAREAQKLGALNVLVSMGEQGALLLTQEGSVLRGAPARLTGPVVNSVGAGDSMVAGFLAGWLRTHNPRKALDLALACGGACVMKEWLPTRADVRALLASPKDFSL